MAELTTRPYQDSDAESVAGLLNAIEIAAGAGHRYSEAEVRRYISVSPQPDHDTRVVHDAAGALVATGIVLPRAPGATKLVLEGGVRPGHRGRGIGRDLLAWQLSRAGELAAAGAADAEWTLSGGAYQSDESAGRLLRRFGMQPVRYFFQMTAPVAGTREAALPAGLRVTDVTDKSLWAAVHEAHTEAFADHWDYHPRSLEDWLAHTLAWTDFRGDLSRVAFDGDTVAAYVLCYDTAAGDVEIGHVGTRRPWRRRGLASALMTSAMAAAAAAGTPRVTLDVDGDSPTGAVGVYERLGFTAQHSPAVVYRATIRPRPAAAGT